MKALLKLATCLFLTLVATCGYSGELLDRLVASVENVPILQSDWDHAIAFEALEQRRVPESMNAEERRGVLDRVVDQQLLRLQMGDENIATAEERDVVNQLEKIRADYPQVKTDEEWRELLSRYGMTQDTLHRDVARQLQVMRFVDLRLRPESRVARDEIEAYYHETLIPEIRRRGGKEQQLTEVYPQIEEILRQQRMNTLLNKWLQDLRGQSDIQRLEPKQSLPAEDDVPTSGGH